MARGAVSAIKQGCELYNQFKGEVVEAQKTIGEAKKIIREVGGFFGFFKRKVEVHVADERLKNLCLSCVLICSKLGPVGHWLFCPPLFVSTLLNIPAWVEILLKLWPLLILWPFRVRVDLTLRCVSIQGHLGQLEFPLRPGAGLNAEGVHLVLLRILGSAKALL